MLVLTSVSVKVGVLHAPCAQTWPGEPHGVPSLALPVAVQTEAPLVQEMEPVLQGAPGGGHEAFVVQLMQDPAELQTRSCPQDVPALRNVGGFVFSPQVGAPVVQDSAPTWHGVAGQSVAGNREARHKLALEDLEAHANGTREDDIRPDRVSKAQSQHPGQPAVGKFEDHVDNQPNAEDA